MLAALLVSMVWLTVTDRPQNSAMEEYRDEYRWYLEKLDGAYTEEKADLLEQEAQAITEARRTRASLQENYYSGQITAEQYERQIAEVNIVLSHEHGFEVAYQQYLYICENTDNRFFLNTNGWTGLFSAQTLDFPLFLVILLLATNLADGKSILAVYMDSPYVYYMTSRTEQYVDRVGSYNSTFTQASVVQLNMETLEEEVIFEKITDSGRSLLGIEYNVGDTWMFLQYCYGFFLNDDSLFFVTNDGITEVGRTIQRTTILDIWLSLFFAVLAMPAPPM